MTLPTEKEFNEFLEYALSHGKSSRRFVFCAKRGWVKVKPSATCDCIGCRWRRERNKRKRVSRKARGKR